MMKGCLQEMLEESCQVIHKGKNLEMVTRRSISNGMNRIAAGANRVNMAVNRVNEISGRNKENIDMQFREASKFKVE
jgi:methyl-accepting chemotaxis protein